MSANQHPAVLDLLDQMVFETEKAVGATSLLQCVWLYDRDVDTASDDTASDDTASDDTASENTTIDMDGLRRFHRNLQRGRLSRRIESSPLPFGRHRWVSPGDRPDLEIAVPRPRAEFDAWLREQADTVVDAEHGPGWHLAALPFTDGGVGISFVITHSLTDGLGLYQALAAAGTGEDDPIVWPAAGSRTRKQARREDARQARRDARAARAAVAAAVREARQQRRGRARTKRIAAPRSAGNMAAGNMAATIPSMTFFVDAAEWDARAESLGGNSNALVAGLSARLAQHVGRLIPDGSVVLSMPVNVRTAGDTRANAVSNIDITLGRSSAPTDLRTIRTTIKQALIRHQDVPDARWAMLPIVPLLPKRVFRHIVKVAAGGSSNVVTSHLGALAPAANRPDGTDADYFAMKSLYPRVTAATMDNAGGVLGLLSGRANGRVFVSVLAYQPCRGLSDAELSRMVTSTLADFSLSADTGWPAPRADHVAAADRG